MVERSVIVVEMVRFVDGRREVAIPFKRGNEQCYVFWIRVCAEELMWLMPFPQPLAYPTLIE